MSKSQTIDLSLPSTDHSILDWNSYKNTPFLLKDTTPYSVDKSPSLRLNSKSLKYVVAGIKKSAFKANKALVQKTYSPMSIQRYMLKSV